MKVEKLEPPINIKVLFKLSSFKLVPKEAGCYVITTNENDILYIGLSVNLYERFQQHLSNPVKTTPTNKGKAIWFYYTIYDQVNLAKLERTWLNQYVALYGQLPILNKINSPIN